MRTSRVFQGQAYNTLADGVLGLDDPSILASDSLNKLKKHVEWDGNPEKVS